MYIPWFNTYSVCIGFNSNRSAAVMPIMVVYQLPHGQLGYSGHILNLPQNVIAFAITLPRSPSNIDVLIV